MVSHCVNGGRMDRSIVLQLQRQLTRSADQPLPIRRDGLHYPRRQRRMRPR